MCRRGEADTAEGGEGDTQEEGGYGLHVTTKHVEAGN